MESGIGYSFEVPPMSRQQIRNNAELTRKILGVKTPKLDIIRVLDNDLYDLIKGYSLEVVGKSDFEPQEFARTIPSTKTIILREDVYDQACDGSPFHRFTAAHELGHLLLHNEIDLKRTSPFNRFKLPAYKCSEWQADCFAGELLTSVEYLHLCESPGDIQKLFNITYSAAEKQFNEFRKAGLI